MANIKLACVVRKDLQFPEGLAMAQASHIGDQWIRDRILNPIGGPSPIIFAADELAWMKNPYIAILGVNCKEELDHVIDLAMKNHVQYSTWTDTVQLQIFDTKFADVLVGASFGPADSDALELVTGNLPLY